MKFRNFRKQTYNIIICTWSISYIHIRRKAYGIDFFPPLSEVEICPYIVTDFKQLFYATISG